LRTREFVKTLVWEFRIFAPYRQILGATAVGYNCVDCEWRENGSAFSLFLLPIVRSCQNDIIPLPKNRV